MKNKLLQSISSGIAATIIMTLLMIFSGMMGMPEMSPPDMLSAVMGVPVMGGWVIHFLIGITFAAIYVYIFNTLFKKINSRPLKGTLYGVVAFILAQVGFMVMGAVFGEENMPAPEGSMTMMMIENIIGHVVFGIVVVLMVKPVSSQSK